MEGNDEIRERQRKISAKLDALEDAHVGPARHGYPWWKVLKIRNLGNRPLREFVLKQMIRVHDEWTDPRYLGNPDRKELIEKIVENTRDEMEAAIRAFVHGCTTRLVFEERPARDAGDEST